MNRKFVINSLVILICCFVSSVSNAEMGFEDAIFPELATSGRALGMGNAYICKVDDSASAFYNPAGFGTARWFHIHLSNLHLEANKGWVRSTSGGHISDAAGNMMKGYSLDGFRELLLENRGTIISTRGHVMPNITGRYYSLGYLIAKQLRATIGKGPEDLFEYADRIDTGPYASLNVSLFAGIIKLGVTGIILNRKEAKGDASSAATFELTDSDYNKGSAVIYTGGARVTLPMLYLPTFAVTVHNTSSTKFKGRGAVGAPDNIKQTIDVGFSLTPQISKMVRLHAEVNYKDLGNAYPAVSTYRKIGLGVEFDFVRTMFFRLGYGDGYGSGGLGIRAKSFEFDFTTYAVDSTSETFRGKEDRRFALTVSVGI